MANKDRPAGFFLVNHGAGGTPNRMGGYSVANPAPADIFSGDLVRTTGDADSETGLPLITLAAPGEVAIGVFTGIRYIDSNGDVQFRPYVLSGQAFTQDGRNPVEALVHDDPGQLFRIQVSGASGLSSADVGQKANIAAGTGNQTTGRSGQQLDGASIGGSGQCKILRLDSTPGNSFGQFADAVVLIDEHENRGTVTAV